MKLMVHDAPCEGKAWGAEMRQGAARNKTHISDVDFYNCHTVNVRDIVTINPEDTLNSWTCLAEDTWKVEVHRLPHTINKSAAQNIRNFLSHWLEGKSLEKDVDGRI